MTLIVKFSYTYDIATYLVKIYPTWKDCNVRFRIGPGGYRGKPSVTESDCRFT